jgi:diguanylate cyclase (GGDEF)-like protein
VSWRITPIVEEDRGVGAVMLGTDVTDSDELTRELERLTASDELTGLASRQVFARMLAAQVEHAEHGEVAAVLAMKVVGIDACAARHGQSQCDESLTKVARALAAGLRPADRLARVGEHHFAVIVAGGTLELARDVAAKMREAARDIRCGSIPLDLAVGVVAVSPGATPDAVYDAAIAAMYRAESSEHKVETADPESSG